MDICNIQKISNSKNLAIIVEPGYLIQTEGRILDQGLTNIYMPLFCLKELGKLGRDNEIARKIRSKYFEDKNLNLRNLKGKERLFVNPEDYKEVQYRAKGIVSLCCALWSEGYQIILLTNSKEIKDLAERQDIDILVVEDLMSHKV